ncbi:MAG: hypothetical protein ACKOYP_07955, partial [Bacteroidota bacterium]
MNKFKPCTLILLPFWLLLLACDSLQNNSTNELAVLKSDTAVLRDSLRSLHQTIDSLVTYGRVTTYVNTFYGSLELSKEENEKQYTEGGVPFDLGNFLSLIRPDAVYSRARVQHLSDPDYHDRMYIGLDKIREIEFRPGKVIVRTTAEYWLYETGAFFNDEELILTDERGL